ncbi:MAG TPA: hypothetical protein DEA05_15320 [Rhodobacteraceae bacterium]|nr:hypothetical protein [Paracoccaceae bacterium]
MRNLLAVATLCAATVAAAPTLAQDCPWAGGSYEFKEHGVYGDFTVNDSCTQLVWSRLNDGTETTSLQRTGNGWKGTLEKADFELLENGKNLIVQDVGGVSRHARADRSN